MKIEDLQAHCVEQMRKLPKTSKMYEEHLLTLAVIDTNKKYFDEIEKKDKIIDSMAEWIFDKDYGKNSLLIDRDDYYSNCIQKVKQYFEELAKEKGEEYARNKI